MKNVEDRREPRRWRWTILVPHLALFLLLGMHRISNSAASFKLLEQNAPRHSRMLGEFSNSTARLVDNASTVVHDPRLMRCGNIAQVSPPYQCEYARKYCRNSRSVVNYVVVHFCTLEQRVWISVPLLVAGVLLAFYWLGETAEKFFSPVAGLMVELLNMSPTMAGVTLLALGNGAPDVFASMAAIGGGNSRIGLGAIISAGTFVSAFVVGNVALVAAPFSVKPLPFARDVLFYSTAVGLVFWVYMKGVVTLWQAVGLMLFYMVFIVVVVCMEHFKPAPAGNEQIHKVAESAVDIEAFEPSDDKEVSATGFDCRQGLLSSWKDLAESWEEFEAARVKDDVLHLVKTFKVRAALRASIHAVLRATIPETDDSKLNRLYAAANVLFCPLLLLYMFRSVISLDHRVVVFHTDFQVPLWCLVFVLDAFLALAFLLSAWQVPKTAQVPVASLAFVMSVCWISLIAGELLGCLATLGLVLGLSPALLGLTVLAWGNSMGDLVADIAIARSGKPEMAIAGCFAGPMFNMLVGLGSALVLHTSSVEPAEYYLAYHPSLLIAFGFLFASLLGSLLVVACCGFQVTRLWGVCLIGLYFTFTAVSVVSTTLLH